MKVRFIDASELFVKSKGINELSDGNVKEIARLVDGAPERYKSRDVDLDELAANSWSWSVSTYVEKEDTREKIDIDALEAQIAANWARVCEKRARLDQLIKENFK